MSIIDAALRSNQRYAQEFELGQLAAPPARKLAVLTCMDARLTIESMLGLATGDAHIIRNAGGIATEDALRSLLISCHLLGTREFAVIGHTDCGMLKFKDEELRDRLHRLTGKLAVVPSQFHSFTSSEQNVCDQVERIKSHPWIPAEIVIRGFVYDVQTGRLNEVNEGVEQKAG